MTLDPSKFYRTRGGRKARIYMIYGEDYYGNYPVAGTVFTADKVWCPYSWTRTVLTSMMEERLTDLVSEWVEPEPKKPRRIAWINSLGEIKFYWDESEVCRATHERAPWLDEPEGK